MIKAFLKQEEEKGAIPKGSVAKVTPLLDHEVTYKKVQLDNGSFLTIDGILEYCGRPIAPAAPAPTMTTTFALSMTALKPAQPPQPGVPEDILQKYKAASSFFDLCRRIQEVITQRRFPEDEGSSAANSNALAMLGIFGGALSPQVAGGSSSSSSSSSNRRTSLMERLRQLQSSDRKLRIEWQSMVRGGGGGGGFGFGGRSNTRDFIAGHQDMEMMDQDIVVALFLHRCNDHQTRIISASTSPPQTFSDMHVVAHAEDMTQVLQRRHKELSATFDQQVSRGGASSTTSGSGRFGGAASSSSVSASASREASALLNMLLRNYPQPVEEDATGTTGAMGNGGLPTASSSSASSATAAGRSVSPHYDLLRMATQVQQASQMSQASWQQMSSMLAAQLSGSGGGSGGGNGGGSAPMFLSFFPQYKEIWTVESGRNDIFEVILILLVLMTLTAPPNDLEEDTTARSNSLGDDDDVLSQVSSSSSHHHHGHHHHHHHNHALAHIVSQLEGTHQRKQLLSAHEDRAAVMATLRRVFKLKGMGTGVAADARVVRGLFDEVIDVHELRHLMYEYHNVQLLQQQSQQQVQQQQQLYAAAVAAAAGGGGGGVGGGAASSSSSLVLSGMGAAAATGMFFGTSSSRGGLSGGGVGGAGDARSPFSPTTPAAVGSHSRSTQSLNLLLGSGAAGVHEPLSTSMMMDHSPFGGHGGSGSLGGGYESTTTAAASTPFRHMSGSVGVGGAGVGGGYTPLSPLYSPPLFGRGGSVGTAGAVGGGGAMGPPPPPASLSTGFSPLGAAMTPITPGGGGGMGGGGGSALRGFNASFSTDMSFGGPGTAEKRYTPFALR